MKRLIYVSIIALIIIGCNQDEERVFKREEIYGNLFLVRNFPIIDSGHYQNLLFNPIKKLNMSVIDSIKVYGQVYNGYRYLGRFKISAMEPANYVKLEFKNDTIFYMSYTGHNYSNTYETFSFIWESDSLTVLNHNQIQIPTNKFNPADSLALLGLYHSSVGENWVKKWNINEPIKYWYGVNIEKLDSLDLYERRVNYYVVKSLTLPFNNLVGTIPEEVFKLKYLDIEACQFVGNKLDTKVVLPNYKDETSLDITLEYFENDSIVFDNHQVMVLLKDGAKIYTINASGEKGDELGVIAAKQIVETINPFAHTPQEGGMGSVVRFGYEGEYIPIKYNEDTVLIFSGFLSVIPLCISENTIKSTYKLDYVREGYDPIKTYYNAYPKGIVKKHQEGRQSGLMVGDMVLLDMEHFSSQEAYLYADYDSHYIFTSYLGSERPLGNLDEGFTDEETGDGIQKVVSEYDGQVLILMSEEWCETKHELKEKVIEGFGKAEKITINYEMNCG